VHQHHHVDVGGDRLRLSAAAFERGATHEGASAREHGFDPIELGRWHDPVTNGNVGADVADPQGLGVEVAQNRAPPPVEAGHTTW
jgi:hypothetical protein